MRTLPKFVLALAVLAAAAAPPLRAAGPLARADETLPGSRVLRTFDFEETKLGNFESTPMFWAKVAGLGYPAYSEGKFDNTLHRSATTSFRLDTQGGSVAYQFAAPAGRRIDIQPNADYYVLAFVRSSGLRHARADLAAWYADEKGNLLLPTETHSQAYKPSEAAGVNGDAWQVLYMYLPGPGAAGAAAEAAQAKSLVLQVGLLQPQQLGNLNDGGLGPFALYQQDIKGSVWIDDITVLQLPRVGIVAGHADSGAPAGVFGPKDTVSLDVQLSDLTGGAGAIKARVRITDLDGLLYGQEDFIPTAANGWAHRVEHAPLPAGMYVATLEVLDAANQAGDSGTLIARRQVRILCLPDGLAAAVPAQEFGLGATSYSDSTTWNELPALLRQTGAGLIQLPVWRRDMSEEAILRRDPAFDGLLTALQRQNVRSIGAFSELPASVFSKIAPPGAEEKSSILALLNADEKLWRPYISMLVTRYANRVDWWELGAPESPSLGMPAGALPASTAAQLAERSAALYGKAHGEMSTLMRRQEMIVPWSALRDFDAERYPEAVPDLRLPSVIKPSQIPAYLENFRTAGGGPLGRAVIAHLEGLDMREASRNERLADFAERIVYAKTAAPEAILFDVTPNKPDELLLVYGAMARALGGSAFIGELPLAAGIKSFLFKKPAGGGTLVMWSDIAGATPKNLDLPLGPAPRSIDLMGNRQPLKPDAGTHLTRVSVGTTPLVVENIEPQVLQLMASFAISLATLPAGAGSIHADVLLKNPYSEGITGSLRMLPPKGWTVDPPSFPVAMPAGGAMSQNVAIQYPFTENAGPKQLTARLDLDPGNPTGLSRLELSYQVMVGSDQIEMEGFASARVGGEIILQQVITNNSGDTLDGHAYALMAGYPRQQRYIVGLQPGQTTIKRYVFTPADFVAGFLDKDAAKGATLGVKQNDGRTLLTKLIPLD